MRARAGRTTSTLLLPAIALLTAIAVSAQPAVDRAGAAPTTTGVAPPTTTAVVGPSTTPTSTTPGPATTTATVTTQAGPPPRSSQRVAAAVDIEKIRPTDLPLRSMAIATAAVIAGLTIAGFVYGKLRSRIPSVAKPRPQQVAAEGATTDPAVAGTRLVTGPPATSLPPPQAKPLPPPDVVSEWAPPTPD